MFTPGGCLWPASWPRVFGLSYPSCRGICLQLVIDWLSLMDVNVLELKYTGVVSEAVPLGMLKLKQPSERDPSDATLARTSLDG